MIHVNVFDRGILGCGVHVVLKVVTNVLKKSIASNVGNHVRSPAAPYSFWSRTMDSLAAQFHRNTVSPLDNSNKWGLYAAGFLAPLLQRRYRLQFSTRPCPCPVRPVFFVSLTSLKAPSVFQNGALTNVGGLCKELMADRSLRR